MSKRIKRQKAKVLGKISEIVYVPFINVALITAENVILIFLHFQKQKCLLSYCGRLMNIFRELF